MIEKKVAIIISSNNPGKLLVDCLNSLKKTSYNNYKIFLVNDSGGPLEINLTDNVEVIITDGNTGFSCAYNLGILSAINWQPDYFLLLNDDTEVIDKDWLKTMVNVGEYDKKIGILGCKIIYPDGSLQNIGGYMKGWKIEKEMGGGEVPFEVDHVMGSFMMIKKEVIQQVGLLDEIFNPYLLEDTDICLRTQYAGFKVYSVPAVTIIHKKGKSVDKKPNYKRMFVRFKNDIIFSTKHLEIKDMLFRIFIYLPMVAIFRKNKDEDELKFKNFRLRKEFPINLVLLIAAGCYVPWKMLSY